MKIYLQKNHRLHLSDFEEEGFDIELENEALYFGAIPMFVASLGKCTFAVMESYSMRLDIPADTITMDLEWDYGEKPTRISNIRMQINWPQLPENRVKAVQRASHMCTIHGTIHACVDIVTKVIGETANP